MPQAAEPEQLLQEERLVRDRAAKTHAGCNGREIHDFPKSCICHNCILAPKVQHTDTLTHTHICELIKCLLTHCSFLTLVVMLGTSKDSVL